MARTILAAGTIPWRVRDRKLEVLLVHRPRYDDWAWPKGKLEAGETLQDCAARETEEETGVAVRLGQPLGEVRYTLPGGGGKATTYWAGVPLDADSPAFGARMDVGRASGREIDDARWVTVSQAQKLLSYKRDHAPLNLLADQYDDKRLETWTVLIVRHGRAMSRSAWKRDKWGKRSQGSEADRPLTPTGEGQAHGLVPLLAAYGVEDVLTSPWERCAATVRPYLEATRIGADMCGELTEAAHVDSPKAVRKLVDRALVVPDVPVAICTHRPVLPTVISRIASYAPRRVQRTLPDDDPWLKPGQVLVAHIARRPRKGAIVVAAETVTPIAPRA